jgi:hypothetical protein
MCAACPSYRKERKKTRRGREKTVENFKSVWYNGSDSRKRELLSTEIKSKITGVRDP